MEIVNLLTCHKICTVRFTFVRFLFFNDPRSQSFQLENWIPLNRIEQNRQSTKLNSCSNFVKTWCAVVLIFFISRVGVVIEMCFYSCPLINYLTQLIYPQNSTPSNFVKRDGGCFDIFFSSTRVQVITWACVFSCQQINHLTQNSH